VLLRTPLPRRGFVVLGHEPKVAALAKLGQDVRHPGLRTSKVRGAVGVFEARASRAVRVTFLWRKTPSFLLRNCTHDTLPSADSGGVDESLNTVAAAELLGVSPSTLRKWADSGHVPCGRTAGGHRASTERRSRRRVPS
jgi:excisionase family DNA binding protein